ncbi:UNVERIFIED_CONTAM: hypothetical protein Slati_3937400 [Sesamum latifolium]|uniref:Uncharacterized protein n=1 Tax=Sesamum latifolium TaxID=2727402 RepID=A0AAW2TMZ1_9LAMI
MLVNIHEYSSWASDERGIVLVFWIQGIEASSWLSPAHTGGGQLVLPLPIMSAPSHQLDVFQVHVLSSLTSTSRKSATGFLARHWKRGLHGVIG